MNLPGYQGCPPPSCVSSDTVLSEVLDLEGYCSTQQDPVAGVSAGEIRVVDHGTFWSVSTSLPEALQIPRSESIEEGFWGRLPDVETQGFALWKYSLGYLPALLDDDGAEEDVAGLLRSAWAWNCSSEWTQRAAEMSSLRHALSIRVRTMAQLRAIYQNRGLSEPPEVGYFVYSDLRFINNAAPEIFSANNHGAMLAIAVAHAEIAFPAFGKALRNSKTSLPINTTARTELLRILNSVFDETGVPNENSPHYHEYWLTILAQFSHLFSLLDESFPHREFALTLEALVTKSTRALDAFIGYAGYLAPIGDSHATARTSEALDSRFVSTTSGFATYRQSGTFLTLNCGHSGPSHKHCDDTSFTVEHNGVGLILDGGFFGHDWRDPKVIYSKSQRAHSGLFLKSFDDLHPGAIYRAEASRIVGTLEQVEEEDNFIFDCRVTVDGNDSLHRRVAVLSPTEIRLEDSILASAGPCGEVVQRFLIPIEANIRVKGTQVEASLGRARMKIMLEQSGYTKGPEQLPPALQIHSGVVAPYLLGWVAPEKNVLRQAYCIEYSCGPDRPQIIRISLSDNQVGR